MAVAWRDMTIPYTEEELDEFTRGFRSLSSYDPESGGTVAVEQVPEVLKLMRMERNAEQIQVYKDYWITHFDGRLYLGPVLNILRNVHKNETYFRSLVENLDKDKDGYISEDEFEDLVKLLPIHDSTLKNCQITFGNFVKEADTNRDGRVSLDECCKWFQNKVQGGY